MTTPYKSNAAATKGFTLIEVVLAIGIFLLTILALVGLLGPTLTSIDNVTQADEVTSVVNSVNTFLMTSPAINQNGSRFDAIYRSLHEGNSFFTLTLYAYRRFDGAGTDETLVVGFASDYGQFSGGNAHATPPGPIIDRNDIRDNASGPVYRVLISASSVTPEGFRSNAPVVVPRYILSQTLENYTEGYLAMDVRIYVEQPQRELDYYNAYEDLPRNLLEGIRDGQAQPIFTYNTAIVR